MLLPSVSVKNCLLQIIQSSQSEGNDIKWNEQGFPPTDSEGRSNNSIGKVMYHLKWLHYFYLNQSPFGFWIIINNKKIYIFNIPLYFCIHLGSLQSKNRVSYIIMSKCINLANAAKHFIFCNRTPAKIGSKCCLHTLLLHRSGL